MLFSAFEGLGRKGSGNDERKMSFSNASSKNQFQVPGACGGMYTANTMARN